jgi:AcrR family transcriptional regulator
VSATGRGPGRRPGNVDTRGEVLAAARSEFAEHGYDKASVRGVARAAGVDPALVHHYFGSKEQLFVATMHLPVVPGEVLPQLIAAGVDGLGERLVRLFLSLYAAPETREPMLALLRSAVSHDKAAAMMRGFVTEALVGRIAAGLDLPDRELRASLVGSHLVGLFVARYIVGLEALARADDEAIIALMGPAVQHYLDGS